MEKWNTFYVTLVIISLIVKLNLSIFIFWYSKRVHHSKSSNEKEIFVKCIVKNICNGNAYLIFLIFFIMYTIESDLIKKCMFNKSCFTESLYKSQKMFLSRFKIICALKVM